MKKIFLAFYLFLIFFFVGTEQAIAQASKKTPEQIASEKGVSFPIAELSNCQNIGECRNYCEDPVHRDTCISFAKKKGFYTEDKLQQNQSQILSQAKKELGCEDIESCQIFCQEPENFDRCDSFAQKTRITGGYVKNPDNREVLQKAEEVLRCNSLEGCKEFCEKEENRYRCSNFANELGLRGGEKIVGPGGCSSEATCERFCQLNPQACKPLQQPGSEYVGPQASSAYENADDRARFCREFPERCSLLSSPTPTPKRQDSQLVGNDGTWCYDSDEAIDGQTSARSKGYCKDRNGSYEDFCADSIYVRDYYCTGTWDGKSWSKVHCEHGGYSCTSYIGSGCSDGACKSPTKSGGTNNTSSGGSSSNQILVPTINQGSTSTPTPISSGSISSQSNPTPTQTPAASTPTPTSPPSSSSSSQGDGSFCEDSDGGNYDSSGSCKDAQGTHSDYCDGETVRDYYCTGTWDGSSWSNRRCEAGGFVCSSAGKTCSSGACVGSVQGVKAQKNIFQWILDWIKQLR